jgi:hypothetical protein
MPGLPQPVWLSLAEAEELVNKITNSVSETTRKALFRAFLDKQITVRGRCEEFFENHLEDVASEDFDFDKAVFDWSSSSFIVEKDDINIKANNISYYHFTDISVCRSSILEWLGNTAGSEKAKAKNSGGRPVKWDWIGALIEVIRVANTPDGLPDGANAQAEIAKIMSRWFMEKDQDEPSPSEIRALARRIMAATSKIGN